MDTANEKQHVIPAAEEHRKNNQRLADILRKLHRELHEARVTITESNNQLRQIPVVDCCYPLTIFTTIDALSDSEKDVADCLNAIERMTTQDIGATLGG